MRVCRPGEWGCQSYLRNLLTTKSDNVKIGLGHADLEMLMVHLCVIIIYILKCIFGLEKKINSNYIILESFQNYNGKSHGSI